MCPFALARGETARHWRGGPPALRRQHPRRGRGDERRPGSADHPALLSVFGRPIRRDLPGFPLQPAGRDAVVGQRLHQQPQHRAQSPGAALRTVQRSGPEQAGFLDGHRQRQDAAAALELQAVPALLPGSRRQRHPDHSQRRTERAAPRRDGGVEHPREALQSEPGFGTVRRQRLRPGHGDHEAGHGEEGRRGERSRRCVRRTQSHLRGRRPQGVGRGGLAPGPRRRRRHRLHVRVQRDLRPSAHGGPERRTDRRIRQGHRVRLLLPPLLQRRPRQGLQHRQSAADGRRAHGCSPAGQPAFVC